MGTQKGRVDVQQQPPSLLQTPQLPGAAPARPEVTRLLPTTRLRLALPLSISLLPPSFALRAFSLFLTVTSHFLLLIITRCRLAHPPSTVIYMRTHSGDDARLLSLSPLSLFSLVAADSARERVRSAIRIRRKRIARFSSAL